MTRAHALIAMLAALWAAGTANGQQLADPTRPPQALEMERAPGADAGSGRLESVLLSPRRKLAVIDGVPVALGAKLGEATLVSIEPAQVVLREPDGDRVLKLYPEVAKKTKNGAAPRDDRGGKR